MKYLLLALLVFVVGCSSQVSIVKKDGAQYLKTYGTEYEIREFEYEGCQYLVVGQGHGQTITHKGNCKYCLERNK